MKQIVLSLMFLCLSAGLWAQEEIVPAPGFKPRYAGTSVDMGMMFMPKFGSAYYVAPKLQLQATPRLFVNTGISVVQYNVLPSKTPLFEGSSQQRTAVGAYVFAEGMYLLSERWSVSGSAMKRVSPQPQPMRNVAPFRVPNEAMHFGVDFRVTPNITIGARVGYSNSGGSYYPY